MTPSRAADRGTAATLARLESLGEVATPTCTPCVSPGCDDRRFLAAGDRVLAPARHLLEHRSRARAPSEVFGAALGTSNSSRSAYGVAAEVATVFCSAVPGLHAGFAGHERMHQVQVQQAGRRCITPRGHLAQVRSTRMLPSNCKIRWASSGGTR